MIVHILLLLVPSIFAQIPVYLRQPFSQVVPALHAAAAPTAMLQCAQQCMPSCLPACSLSAALVQNQQAPSIYQPYDSSVFVQPTIVQPLPEVASVQVPAPESVVVQTSSGIYQPYGPPIAQYPVIVPVCAQACMPACTPTCVVSQEPQQPSPSRDDLPTPPPEPLPTPPPEIITTPKPNVEENVIPCKCLVKITVTQGSEKISKCSPNACTCPQGYIKCGDSNCCKA